MVPEKFGYFPEYQEVIGNPREKLWALWGIRGKHTSPQGAAAPPLGRRPNWNRFGGRRPPFLLSYSSFPSSPTPTREGGNPTPGGSRTPLGRAIERAGPPLLHSLIYGGGGHPIDTQVDQLIF